MGEAKRKKQESERLERQRRERLHRFALPGAVMAAVVLGLALIPYSRANTQDEREEQVAESRATPDEQAARQIDGPERPPSPSDSVQVYVGGREGWRTISCGEVQRGQQFLFQGYLLQSNPEIGALQLIEGVTEKKLRETLKDYDRATHRSPEAEDAVEVLGAAEGRREFALLRDVAPGRRVVFQSAVYETALDGDYLAIRFTGDVFKRVTQTFERPANTIIDLHVRSEGGVDQVISGTPEHPFFVPAVNDYVPMGRLTEGTVLKTSDGTLATVTSSSRRQGDFTVYNFEVEDTHNYYVAGHEGAPAVLVHNTCGPPVNVTPGAAPNIGVARIGPGGRAAAVGRRVPGTDVARHADVASKGLPGGGRVHPDDVVIGFDVGPDGLATNVYPSSSAGNFIGRVAETDARSVLQEAGLLGPNTIFHFGP